MTGGHEKEEAMMLIVTAELHQLSTCECVHANIGIPGTGARSPAAEPFHICWRPTAASGCPWPWHLKARGSLDSFFFSYKQGQQIVIANVYAKPFSSFEWLVL